MIQWWEALSQAERFLAIIAIPSTLILAIQTIMLLFGLAGHGSDELESDTSHFDAGHDHDGHIEFDPAHELDADHDVQDGHDHGDHDYDAGLRIFTVRGFVAFFTMFGWTGLAMMRSGINGGISIGFGVICGIISMVAIAVIMKLFMKLQSDGTFEISHTLGRSGTVYLTIPAARKDKGKVTILAGDHLVELDAVTDNESPLKTGEEVTVIALSGSNTLVVRPK